MPLTAEARLKETEEAWRVVDITRYSAPKASLAHHELRCPECKSPMHIRSYLLRITHFAHNPGAPRDCALRNGETIYHFVCKQSGILFATTSYAVSGTRFQPKSMKY